MTERSGDKNSPAEKLREFLLGIEGLDIPDEIWRPFVASLAVPSAVAPEPAAWVESGTLKAWKDGDAQDGYGRAWRYKKHDDLTPLYFAQSPQATTRVTLGGEPWFDTSPSHVAPCRFPRCVE